MIRTKEIAMVSKKDQESINRTAGRLAYERMVKLGIVGVLAAAAVAPLPPSEPNPYVHGSLGAVVPGDSSSHIDPYVHGS